MTRWRKVFRDLAETPGRSALAVLAMAAGVFGVGAMLTAQSILTRELDRTWTATNPATLILHARTLDVDAVRRLPGVREVEPRPLLMGRIRIGNDEWLPLALFVVRDFADIRIDRITLSSGAWPRAGEIAIERSSLSLLRGGQRIVAHIDGREEPLRVSGTVHAAGLAPGWMDHIVAGFVSWRDVEDLRLLVRSDRTFAFPNARVETPPSGHPHADQMNTFLYLLGAFGLLTLVLSALLVANIIHALLANQVRQLGVMKTVGASTSQLVAMSLVHVALLAAMSLLVAMPLALSAGRAYARFSASMLNASLSSVGVPMPVLLTQLAVGVLVPVAVALIPIHRATRISIHTALGRDPVQRRERMLLTTTTLAIGGAVFIAALNVSQSWSKSIDDDFRARRYDIDVRLRDGVGERELARIIRTVPDVVHVESWIEASRDGYALVGLDSRLLALPLIEGRWFAKDGEYVINQALAAKKPKNLRIVGVVKELGSGPTAYASRATVGSKLGTTANARVRTRSHGAATARDIERALQRANLPVAHVQRLTDRRRAIEDHLVIIESAIFFAATLVVLVGGLALLSSLTLNVVSRTRELGVLSAIGATPRIIATRVVREGVRIGVLSWVFAIAVSMPATWLMDRATGTIFIKTPVEFLIAPRGIFIWLALVVLLGAISSFYPAWRATRIPVREALSYE
ncbi:MAG TPA: FtsX-like permease family protein [Thermoanaerobaculia bacterium]|nr:FtsX-like permease family protein [Thermoanaerobaculia bacterium]